MVEEGGTRRLRRGTGRWSRPNPPPPPTPPTPPQIALPQWLLKVLGPGPPAARKVEVIPWSAQALQEARNGAGMHEKGICCVVVCL